MISYEISLSFWLTLLSMIISRSIHVAADGIISFFFMVEWYSIVYMHHIFFIHSSVNEHLGRIHVLTTVNSAAMRTGVRISFQIIILFRYMPRGGIALPMLILSLVLWWTFWLFPIVATPIHIPTNSVGGLSFSTPSPAFVIYRLFNDGHSDHCEVVPHRSCDLHFSNN